MKIKLHKCSLKHSPTRTGNLAARIVTGWPKGRHVDEGFFVPRHLLWGIIDHLKVDDDRGWNLLTKLVEMEK
jgi:hypothetical protein